MGRGRKYKVGDKVLVRDNLQFSTNYYMEEGSTGVEGIAFLYEMRHWMGEIVTIADNDFGWGGYGLEETKGTLIEDYRWSDGMFVGLAKEVKNEVKAKPEVINDEFFCNFTIIVKRVIYSDPATIIVYSLLGSDTEYKSVAKKLPTDEYSKETGVQVAILKAYRKEMNRMLRKI